MSPRKHLTGIAAGTAAVAASLLAGLSGGSLVAAEPAPTPEQVKFFETKVRPLLAEQCYSCHGPQREIGGLRLDSRAAALKGGGAGPAVVPGHPEKSLLIQAVNYQGRRMPPAGKLKAEQITILTEWVKMGAPWPSGEAGGHGSGERRKTAVDRIKEAHTDIRTGKRASEYWAFQPVKQPQVPQIVDGGWSRNAVDRFVFQKLKATGLSPAPEADRATLIRRLYFDLIGLPPAPEEVAAFVNDPQPDAYEKLVDRLLASPRYGEKWARHWLDLVRYADSDGYRIDHYRPHAWRYRDYVIRSFNQDRPYNRFVQEQLAADELFPNDPEAITGLGYLRHGIYEYNNRDVRGQWTTILDDITDTTGDVFLGLGVQCARCHDHKFDPILQKDYYRLRAFFAPIQPEEERIVATPEQIARHRQEMAVWEQKTAEIRRQLDALEAPYRKAAEKRAVEIFPEDIQAMINKPVAQREPLEHQLATLAYRQVYFEYDRLETRIKGTDKEKYLALKKQLAAFDKEKPEPLPTVMALSDVGPQAPPVLIPKKGKEPIEPGFLSVFDPQPAKIAPIPGRPQTTGRRAALARWLTQPENPLTGRVIVNRVWQYHFGRGLAANASDFGRLGDVPTHPELLDWLASAFVAPTTPQPPVPGPAKGLGWSLKRLHRLLVTSATYRQATRHPQAEAYRLKDPENRLYWRGNTRRLEAEQIRDAVYAVTGELDLKAGGPGVNGSDPRRTIYIRYMRNARDPLLDVFDLPLFFSSTSSRDTTTTPVQSLLLFNSQTMLLRAKAFAQRLERETGGDETQMIARAYQLAFSRPPRTDELQAARQFLSEQAARINPMEAGSDAAAFLYDKLPFRDGQAAILSPEGPQRRFEVAHNEQFPTGDFTLEAFVLPRSVYETGAVRTIAAKWSGDHRAPGWGFGITGKQSRRKPQTLVLQFIGKKLDGTVGEEAIFSDQHIQINKPYYVAAAVELARNGKPGTITFYAKDLSNDDEPLLVARVPHRIVGGFGNSLPLTLGGRDGRNDGLFDGLVDDVRLSSGALGAGELLFTREGSHPRTIGYWQFEAKPDVFHDTSGHGLNIQPASARNKSVDPRRGALADFCQALLNSNEFLYVD